MAKKFTFYVSASESAQNEGWGTEICKSFPTLESAREAARQKAAAGETVEVVLREGTYFTRGLTFDGRDRGIVYRAEGEVTLTGGVSIPETDFCLPPEEIRARLSEEAREHVRMVDLTKYGFCAEDWGEISPIGAYQTSRMYDKKSTSPNLEVFYNSKRMRLARYPNQGEFLHIEAVMDVGDVAEFPPQNYFRHWGEHRNPRPGVYVMDQSVNERVKGWRDPDAWLFGYLFWDWADSSTPVRFDTDNRLLLPEYVSQYGCRSGALYYLYNILEELDEPGEWYLDRSKGLLYFYPDCDGGVLEVSIATEPLISGKDVCGVTLDGFRLQCTRSDGIVWTGESDGNHLKNLTLTNLAGCAIQITGSGNVVERCEISHTGKGGIWVTGGDRVSLTPGSNVVTENFIHDFSEVYLTYQPGIAIHGVGNVCSHNEICRSPHMAIGYSGNDEVIEYNYIHDVVLQSSDAGAIYAGYNWTAHGCVIRYNFLENIGGGSFTPDGIYWDDGLSGQAAYGNILVNVRKHAILIGGGRDCEVVGNVIINTEERIGDHAPILYDDRNRDGFVRGGWAKAACNTPESPHWNNLRAMPYRSEKWAKKYPALARLKQYCEEDVPASPELYDDPDFPINPANSIVRGNVIVNPSGKGLSCADSVYRYSIVEDNPVYRTLEESGLDLPSPKEKH